MRVASPTIDLDVHRCNAGRVVVRASGDPGRADAAILRRTLDLELDRAPGLLVVELDHAVSTPDLRAALAAARDRARAAGAGLRVVVADDDAVGAREITDLL